MNLHKNDSLDRAPRFTLNQDRLINGVPSVSVHFPNGHTDKLILDKHEGECNYLGHLEKDSDACVAMTGCLGRDPVEFTILSRHAEGNPHLTWHPEGHVEVMKKVHEVKFLI